MFRCNPLRIRNTLAGVRVSDVATSGPSGRGGVHVPSSCLRQPSGTHRHVSFSTQQPHNHNHHYSHSGYSNTSSSSTWSRRLLGGLVAMVPTAVLYKAYHDRQFNYDIRKQFPVTERVLGPGTALEKNIEALFESFDTNGDGFITAHEFRSAFIKLQNHEIPEEDIRAMIEYADKNGDNQLSFWEFYNLMVELQLVEQRFNQTDLDHDGYISKEELKELLCSGGLSSDVVDNLTSGIDSDSDGRLSFDEYARLAMRVRNHLSPEKCTYV